MKPSLGRIVLVKIAGKLNEKGEPTSIIVPAIIVKVLSDTCINVRAFNDGSNDLDIDASNTCHQFWLTSVTFDETGNLVGVPTNNMNWIWPPKI